jgi:hypothetical protein
MFVGLIGSTKGALERGVLLRGGRFRNGYPLWLPAGIRVLGGIVCWWC